MTQGARRWLAGLVVAALVAAAFVVLTGPPAAAAGSACRKTYSSTGGPYVIPDHAPGPGMTITVPDVATVADIDVTVNATHDDDQELWIFFTNNAGGATLAAAVGRGGANFTNTTFDDEASIGIGAGTAPFTGRFQPEIPLSRYDGSPTQGNWRVEVSDIFPSGGTSGGSLIGWSMSIEFTSCDFDGDGVEDHRDSCLGLSAATASGCPVVGRTLSAKYRHGAFRGTLGATVQTCSAGVPVTVWRVRAGPDRRVGTTTTRSDGTYQLRRTRHRGRYYATALTTVVTDIAECAAVTSPRFRVR